VRRQKRSCDALRVRVLDSPPKTVPGSEIGFGGQWHGIKLAGGGVDIVLGAGHFEPGFVVFVVVRQRRPWRGEGAGIVDLHRDIEIAGIAPAIALHDVQFIRMRRREIVDPASWVEPDGIDDQRVALPMRHRIPKPARLHCGGVARIQARNAPLAQTQPFPVPPANVRSSQQRTFPVVSRLG
jgi:hypothetical protein